MLLTIFYFFRKSLNQTWLNLSKAQSNDVVQPTTLVQKCTIDYRLLYSEKTYLCYDLKAKFLIDNNFQAAAANDSLLFETFEIISKEVESNIKVDTAKARLRQLSWKFWLIDENLVCFILIFSIFGILESVQRYFAMVIESNMEEQAIS